MRIRNAFKISVGNYMLVFKNLLFKLLIFCATALIAGAILRLQINDFITHIKSVLEEIKNIAVSVYNGNVDSSFSSLRSSLDGFYQYLSANVGNFLGTGAIIFIGVFVYRYLGGMGDCAVMISVNDYMTSMSRPHFTVTLVEHFGKIAVYQLIDVLFTLVFDIITACVIIGVGALTLSFSVPLFVFLALSVWVCSRALRSTVISQVMANILIVGKTVKDGFSDGIVPPKGYFGKMFVGYLTVTLIYFYLLTSSAIITFGVGTVLLIPFFSLLYASMREVDYFTINKKKYFIDYDNIVVPKELRENDENLLNNIDI